MDTYETIDKLLTLDELACQLGGMSHATVYRHIKDLPGFPQPVKIGGATRFRQSDIQAFIRGDDRDQEHEEQPNG